MTPRSASKLLERDFAREEDVAGLSRRRFMGSLAAASLPLLGGIPARALAQAQSVLPLNTPGLDHLDIIVPDVAASAQFYMGLFNTRLHAQPFQGGFRYFVLLGEMNERREVGYIAIGESRGRGTYIGHFCTSVSDWRRDSQAIWTAMEEGFREQGFGDFPGATGIGGIFADPDGIEIQFLPAPDTLVTAAVPSDTAPSNQGPVTPLAIDQVLLTVSDLERATAWYNILYGAETGREVGRAWFDYDNGSRLVLEQAEYAYGQSIGISRFRIATRPFDRRAVADTLAELGAQVLESPDEPEVLRFRDPDGIVLELAAR